MANEPEHRISKRGRIGEGRPTKRTPEAVTTIAQAIASGLTDEEAGLLAGINRTNLSALEHAGPCATNASLFPSGHVKKTRHYDQHRVIFPSDRR